MYTCGNLNFSLQGLGSMGFYCFSFLCYFIPLLFNNLDHSDPRWQRQPRLPSEAEPDLHISPRCWEEPVSQPRVPRISPGQLRCCHGTGEGSFQPGQYESIQSNQRFSSRNLHSSFIHGALPNKSLILLEPSSTNFCIWANSGCWGAQWGSWHSCFAPTRSSVSACSADMHKVAYQNETQTKIWQKTLSILHHLNFNRT